MHENVARLSFTPNLKFPYSFYAALTMFICHTRGHVLPYTLEIAILRIAHKTYKFMAISSIQYLIKLMPFKINNKGSLG